MAINSNNEVNLIDIITTENGITKLPKNYKINGSFYFLDYKNVYDKNTLSDFKYNKLPKINIFEKDIKKFYKSRKGSIVATWSSETNYDVFQSIYIDTSKPFIVNGFCKIINVIDINLINPKWLTFYLNFNPIIQKQRSSIPYTTRCNMTLNELKNIKIKIIPIESQQEIINIVEPFEKLKVHLLNRKTLIIKLLNDLYLLNSSKNEKDILSFASLYNKKYQNQISYIETSNIDENFSLINNIKTIQKDKKPSRANLTPRENSLIFSKLIGSNKLFPIYDKKYLNYVYSTGFYNISSNDLDWYLFGFLNSDDFIKQKNNNSSGTLMEGITINGLKEIKIKLPKNNYHLNSILHLISKHNIIIKKIDNIISYLINLYIV